VRNSESIGFDGGKLIKGRKRHMAVDTMGLMIALHVTGAQVQDRDGARELLTYMIGTYPRMALIWADGAYAGQLVEWVTAICKWTLQIVKRSDNQKGFKVLPRRWVVERTFGWLGRYRRLSKDYEFLTQSSEAMIRLALINNMTRRPTETASI
jgi:putative transposase